ncbi:hypothetical protein ACFLYY_00845 [Patescibacteria group bacterium]
MGISDKKQAVSSIRPPVIRGQSNKSESFMHRKKPDIKNSKEEGVLFGSKMPGSRINIRAKLRARRGEIWTRLHKYSANKNLHTSDIEKLEAKWFGKKLGLMIDKPLDLIKAEKTLQETWKKDVGNKAKKAELDEFRRCFGERLKHKDFR